MAFQRNLFLLISFLFPGNSFERSLNLFPWNLNTFTKHKELSLFSFYLFIFYSLFRNHCVYQLSPPFCTFLLHVNTQNGSVLVLLAISESLYVTMLSTFCDWTGSLKRTPTRNFMLSIFHVNYLDETYYFLRLDLPQLKLECLNCQKSDIRTNSPCCNVLLWPNVYFLQVNQQKRIRMVSSNNITYSEQIYKPF